MTTQELQGYVESKGGSEITKEINAAAADIIDQARSFFDLANVKVYAFPNCRCRACEGGILLDYDQILAQADSVQERLDAGVQADGVWRAFEKSALFWYAAAHEFGHHLQATKKSWEDMKADAIVSELGADFLAGVCIGWYVVDYDINFLSAIDAAWEVGMEPLVVGAHPPREHRKLAVSTGVSQGARAAHCLTGDMRKIKLDVLLDVSAEVATKVLTHHSESLAEEA